VKNLRVIIITGLSGSGKSTALHALEDIGFFCVDNLPVMLLPKFLEIQGGISNKVSKVALVMDARERHFLERHADIISKLRKKKYDIDVIFLKSSNDVLLRRFSETRRSHPLSEERTVLESILFEREKLQELEKMADSVIDTSFYSVHQLKGVVQRICLGYGKNRELIVNLVSFGYRYGLPSEADIVMDVRFLPNPYFVDDLKDLGGNDPRVEEYVMKWSDTKEFLDRLFGFTDFMIPMYKKEGKAYLNIAVGCTGGRHRSVVIADQMAKFFTKRNCMVNINHRDINKI
jgi:UPF0042 nucleotide-binding protein